MLYTYRVTFIFDHMAVSVNYQTETEGDVEPDIEQVEDGAIQFVMSYYGWDINDFINEVDVELTEVIGKEGN